MLALIAVPLVLVTWKREGLRALMLLGAFGVLTHLVMDVFQSPTPLFWPLSDDSFSIQVALDFHIGSAPTITGSSQPIWTQGTIEPFKSFDAPILTAPGLGISLVLLAPTLAEILWSKLMPSRGSRPDHA
jgi:hypothetical protein